MAVFLRIFLIAAWSILGIVQPALAQGQVLPGGKSAQASAPELSEPLSPEAVREMVARMSDDQVRAMLLDRLDAVAQRKETPEEEFVTVIDAAQNIWRAFYTPTLRAVQRLPHLFQGQLEAVRNFAGTFDRTGLLFLFAFTAAAIAAGLAAEFLVNRLTRRWQRSGVAQIEPNLWGSLNFLFWRLCRELLGLIAFFIIARLVSAWLMTPQQVSFAGPFIAYLIWFPRLGAALARFMLTPLRPELRLVNVSDRWARYLYIHLIGLFVLVGVTFFVVGFNIQTGVPLAQTQIAYWLGGAVNLYIAVIAWRAREGLVQMMRGSDPDRTEFDEAVARAYPYFAIFVAASMWVLVQILTGLGQTALLLKAPHYTTMFWLLMAPALDTAIRGLVQHLLPPMAGDGKVAEAAYRSTKRSYIRIGRMVVGVLVILMIAAAWDINLMNIAAAGVGERFAGNVIEFLMIAAIGFIVYEMASLWINRQLAREQTAKAPHGETDGSGDGAEIGGAGRSRLATVLPLVRITVQIAIGVIFGLLAIGALGVDITPLLAGAGILGLAIGFGAQKLVSDVVSGIFFLIDDAFRVGEYVEVDGTMGTVEKISIRSMQLRHHRGLVHTIPYGGIPKLTNYSRDWVIMKLMFTVPFDTDPNKVKKIFKKIGAEMMEDPLFKDSFLDPFKSQGVFQFNDVGIVMRGKFMAKPGTQFTIRKEIYNRVRTEFAANGIEFARREVRVAIPGLDHDDHLTDDQKSAIGAGASGAVLAQMEKEEAEKK